MFAHVLGILKIAGLHAELEALAPRVRGVLRTAVDAQVAFLAEFKIVAEDAVAAALAYPALGACAGVAVAAFLAALAPFVHVLDVFLAELAVIARSHAAIDAALFVAFAL